MKGFTLKLRDNLWISGNRIISYETEVGQIKGDTIISYGKFTRTTTKQIYHIASLGGYKIQEKPKSIRFWKHEVGVRCDSPGRRLLSKSLSEKIVSGKLVNEPPANVLLSIYDMGKKDLSTITSHLIDNKIMNKEDIDKVREFSKLLASGML